MKDSKGQRIVRRWTNAILDIDRLWFKYEPRNTECIGKIATALIHLYELFGNYKPDLTRMIVGALQKFGRSKDQGDVGELSSFIQKLPTVHKHLTYQCNYFRSEIFNKQFCLVLERQQNGDVRHYGYSRKKLLEFLRGETVHARTVNANEDQARTTLRNFVYEEIDRITPVFAIRRDFIHFANVIKERENDSHSAYDEPITLKSGESHSLTTIESLVFSICNEHTNMFKTGKMKWDKSCFAFNPTKYREILREEVATNIIHQSARWNEWNSVS